MKNTNPREWRYMKGLVAFGLIGRLEALRLAEIGTRTLDDKQKLVRKAS